MKTWTVRSNCEFSQTVVLPDDSTEDDAITEVGKKDVMEWESAEWSPNTAEEE